MLVLSVSFVVLLCSVTSLINLLSWPGVYNFFAIAGCIAYYLYEVRPPMSSSYIYEILPSANQCCQLFLQQIYQI